MIIKQQIKNDNKEYEEAVQIITKYEFSLEKSEKENDQLKRELQESKDILEKINIIIFEEPEISQKEKETYLFTLLNKKTIQQKIQNKDNL